MQMTTFLKRVLILDSASCLIMGAGLLFGANMISVPFGLPGALLAGAGWALLPIGTFIGFIGTRPSLSPALVWLVIAGNLAWVIESLVLSLSTSGITPMGTAFVLAQACAVFGMAALEFAGMRQAARLA